MKTIFLTLALTVFCQILLAQTVYMEEYKQKWANARDFTMELAEAMPEEFYDFKPTEEQMTFKEQLLHIMGNMSWLTSSYLGGKKIEADLKKTDYTKEELLELLRQGFANGAEAVDNFPLDQLEDKVEFFAGPMSKRQILVLMNDHVVHHRGQIIVYARLKGIKPPRFRGW